VGRTKKSRKIQTPKKKREPGRAQKTKGCFLWKGEEVPGIPLVVRNIRTLSKEIRGHWKVKLTTSKLQSIHRGVGRGKKNRRRQKVRGIGGGWACLFCRSLCPGGRGIKECRELENACNESPSRRQDGGGPRKGKRKRRDSDEIFGSVGKGSWGKLTLHA